MCSLLDIFDRILISFLANVIILLPRCGLSTCIKVLIDWLIDWLNMPEEPVATWTPIIIYPLILNFVAADAPEDGASSPHASTNQS